MGKPNFQRLAELGQLPDYIKPTVNEALAQVDAMRKEKKEELVEDIKGELEVPKKFEEMTKRELVEILEDMKLDTKGNKKELIDRIEENNQVKNTVEIGTAGSTGEFVDDIIK